MGRPGLQSSTVPILIKACFWAIPSDATGTSLHAIRGGFSRRSLSLQSFHAASAASGCNRGAWLSSKQTRKGGRMRFFFFLSPQARPDNAALLQRVLGAGGCRVTRAGSHMQQVYQSGSRFSVLLEVAEIN